MKNDGNNEELNRVIIKLVNILSGAFPNEVMNVECAEDGDYVDCKTFTKYSKTFLKRGKSTEREATIAERDYTCILFQEKTSSRLLIIAKDAEQHAELAQISEYLQKNEKIDIRHSINMSKFQNRTFKAWIHSIILTPENLEKLENLLSQVVENLKSEDKDPEFVKKYDTAFFFISDLRNIAEQQQIEAFGKELPQLLLNNLEKPITLHEIPPQLNALEFEKLAYFTLTISDDVAKQFQAAKKIKLPITFTISGNQLSIRFLRQDEIGQFVVNLSSEIVNKLSSDHMKAIREHCQTVNELHQAFQESKKRDFLPKGMTDISEYYKQTLNEGYLILHFVQLVNPEYKWQAFGMFIHREACLINMTLTRVNELLYEYNRKRL